ncbi:MAG: hypothetical protein IPK00_16445 [Deltaproteobacteria bacterium]|nr:hypothetical protein [Deltaproteobacteria bacterium]
MTEPGMRDEDRLALLLELAKRAGLELRILSAHAAAEEGAPRQSSAGRLGERVWVLLVPDDPTSHQAATLAQALGRHRAAFLESCFLPPALRTYIDEVMGAPRGPIRGGP